MTTEQSSGCTLRARLCVSRCLSFFQPIMLAIVFGCGLMTFAGLATAATGDCVPWYDINAGDSARHIDWTDTTAIRDVRIKYDSNAGTQLGISQSEFHAAADASASVWNENANAGGFRFVGTTTYGDNIPTTSAGCASAGIDFSVIELVDRKGVKGRTETRCDGEQFYIQIFAKELDGTYRDWTVGDDAASGNQDMLQTMVHEFGHTLGLWHPGSSEAAAMAGTRWSENSQRDLYQWDLKCAYEESGKRGLDGYYHSHANGSFGGSTQFTFNSDASKGTIGWDQYLNEFSYALMYSNCGVHWKNGWDACVYSERRLGTAPTSFLYNSNPYDTYVVYPYYKDGPTEYAWDSSHRAHLRWSDDAYQTQSSNWLKQCVNMSGWETCASDSGNDVRYVTSGHRYAVAWNYSIGRNHVVWTNQNRDANNSSRQIFIATDHTQWDHVLNDADALPVQSKVGPGVACDRSGNCIVAYVDADETLNRIRVRKFTASAGSNRYQVNLNSTTYSLPSGTATGSSIAAWYHAPAGKFFVAFRSYEWGQPTRVYSSTNGQTWYQVTGTSFADSLVGPSAAGFLDYDNRLVVWQ